MSYYAPPDTGVPNLRLVTVEHLPSIEGADRICRSAPFCGEIIFICSALGRGGALLLQNSPQRLPLQGPIPPIRGKCPEGTKGVGMLSAKQTERLSQIRLNLSVPASPSHLPWKGRLWGCAHPRLPLIGEGIACAPLKTPPLPSLPYCLIEEDGGGVGGVEG